jgi:predicted metal-dependent hydrolase
MNKDTYALEDLIIQLWESRVLKDDLNPQKIKIEFYSYTTLKNTIKIKDDRIFIRISDMLKDSPKDMMFALIMLLFSKLEGRKIPRDQENIYKDYVNSKKILNRIKKRRKERVKKNLMGHSGDHYDLKDSFARVNKKYFNSELTSPTLSWSRERTRTRFGHHDEALNTIVISKTLDDRNIPRYLLDYVMFHELLHIKHGIRYKNGRRSVHSANFKEDERIYHQKERAETLLKKLSAGSF